MARERSRRGRGRRSDSPIAQVLIWMAWQGRACAASQRLPKEDFTKPHREHHTLTLQPASTVNQKHLSKISWLSKPQHGEAPHRGCSRAVDPEERDHPDLLEEEAADETVR
jgi:hypothetical protein